MRNFYKVTSSVGPLLLLLSTSGMASAQLFQEQGGALANQPCNGQGCWTNYARLTDIDNDGDLDVLLPNAAGFGGTQGASQTFGIFRNDGNLAFSNVSASALNDFSGWVRQVATADITGDGFVDLYAPSAWGTDDKFFINDGTGKFTDELSTRLPNTKSRAGFTRFGDLDNDGDLDLLVGDDYSGNTGKIAHLYLNDGTGKFAEAPWDLPTNMDGDQPIDVDLLDMDGDFDLDLFINQHFGNKGQLWQNDGTGKFTDLSANIPTQMANNYFRYGPVACDVDGDGDLDIWQDNARNPGGLEQLLINDGSGNFTDETVARVTGNSGADDNGLACIDADGDGDFDAVIFNLGNAERLLINDGTGKFTFQAGAFPSSSDSTLWIEFGDLNSDGRLDYISAQGEGSTLDKIFYGTNSFPVDTVQPKLREVEVPSGVGSNDSPVVRFAVSDNATTDEGPRLQKAFIKINAPAAMEVAAKFMGGDLFRAVLPKQSDGATVTYQACAIDKQGNQGCSPEFTYTVSGMAGTGGAGTGGNGTGGAGTGASGTGGNGTGASGGNGTGAGGPGSGGSGGSGGNNLNLDDGGCGCTIPGGQNQSGLLGLGLASALVAIGRRRRNRTQK